MKMSFLHGFRGGRARPSIETARWYAALCRWLCGPSAPAEREPESQDSRQSAFGEGRRRAELLHRLKTPLLGIRQLSELLLQAESLSADGLRKVDIIRRTAAEGMSIVDELLTPRSGRSPRRTVEEIDLGKLVQEVAARLRPIAVYKGQRIRLAAEKNCTVRGDGIGLGEVIENLIGNALKYSPPDSPVSVRVERGNRTVRLIVSDQGPGVSVADQGRLFRPFQRLAAEPTGGEVSSGLGLYLTKQIVEAHGGRIGVVSAPEKGSTFVVVLPRSSTHSGPVEREAG